MSKSAIHAMTMSLATEWGRYGIRLNAIAPGEIPTEGMSKRLNPGDEAGARTKKMNPLGRVGTMEELENLAIFLISAGCDWINGETIALDGAQALAIGAGFYELRNWSDADWQAARERSRRRTRRTGRSAGVMHPPLSSRGAHSASPGPITPGKSLGADPVTPVFATQPLAVIIPRGSARRVAALGEDAAGPSILSSPGG